MRTLSLILIAASSPVAAKPRLNTETFWGLRSSSDPQITKDAKRRHPYVLG